jgi:hypothetical protein
LTDRDIQEGRFNRRLEDWQEEIQRDQEFRKKNGMLVAPDGTAAAGDGGPDGESGEA